MGVLEWIVGIVSAVFVLFQDSRVALCVAFAAVVGIVSAHSQLPKARRPPMWKLYLSAILWFGYALYAGQMEDGHLNIRADVVIICPLMLLTTIGLVESWFKGLRPDKSG